MGFRDLDLQKVYDTRKPGDDPVNNFYIPVLREAHSYDRGTGYFSSTVLALAARGIAGLILNGGRMRILTSPELTLEDLETLQRVFEAKEIESFAAGRLAMALGDLDDLANQLAKDHLKALAWMIAEGTLEIRIVLPKNIVATGGMLHFKIGVVRDDSGDTISFSGSNNESMGGWVRNIEQIKVFKDWDQDQGEYLQGDIDMFERYWNSSEDLDITTIPLPEAIKAKLTTFAPSDASELAELLAELSAGMDDEPPVRKLREYQSEAVRAWVDNQHCGILEMATGTGKTLTAISCIDLIRKQSKNSVVVVVVPQVFLSDQWEEQLSQFEPVIVNGGTPWDKALRDAKSDLALGLKDHLLLIAVQNTAASPAFIAICEEIVKVTSSHLLVVDEVHGAGANQFSRLLQNNFEKRLGLSATPTRWFDAEGSERLIQYFGDVVFKFGIHEALHWVDPVTGVTPLCPYDYHPQFVDLTEEEGEEYEILSEKIKSAAAKGGDSDNEYLKLLLIKRSRIIKKASNKIAVLESLISGFEDQANTLVYCSDSEQLDLAAEVLNRLGVRYRRFSGEEGAFPRKELGGLSEREVIMNDFESGKIDVLLAMKCLDEGVDIPSARRGIILASSTNPREFIQRRGRLLRRSPGKSKAEIYDVLVFPFDKTAGDANEMAILKRELDRVEEFAQDAKNEAQVRTTILEKTWQILKSR